MDADPTTFWESQARESLNWLRPWRTTLEYNPQHLGVSDEPYVAWFADGQLNAAANCLDRHVAAGRGEETALIWQGEDGRECTLSYAELLNLCSRAASALQRLGVAKGDRVTIFLPMIPEAAVAMLACARIGAPHSVVFSAFSAAALAQRLADTGSKVVITADASNYNGHRMPLKETVDRALGTCPSVTHSVVVQHTNQPANMESPRDVWWHEALAASPPAILPPAVMDSEDPLFMLYTSGSTGQPKAIVHSTAGYLLQAHVTFKHLFAGHKKTIHYCTADVGWITGHSYVVYGPLSNGVTTLMYEGHPMYPKPDRLWRIIERHRVTSFYTAPTAIRALMQYGNQWPASHDLSSLKVLGSVGEPINPSPWQWYFDNIGGGRCPVIDTWWQTETGGIMIAPLPHTTPRKPGSATKALPGISAAVLREDGQKAAPNKAGALVITRPWPGMLRRLHNDARYIKLKATYFSQFPGCYSTGDGARIDEDGDFWLLGRIDDVINVSAHRFSSAEIEHVLTSHADVAEAAVVGAPHPIKGQGLHCFVTLRTSVPPTEDLKQELVSHLRQAISPIATPEKITFTPALPKTRSGKIMRRILRAIAAGDESGIGDTTTLADPAVVDHLRQYNSNT